MAADVLTTEDQQRDHRSRHQSNNWGGHQFLTGKGVNQMIANREQRQKVSIGCVWPSNQDRPQGPHHTVPGGMAGPHETDRSEE